MTLHSRQDCVTRTKLKSEIDQLKSEREALKESIAPWEAWRRRQLTRKIQTKEEELESLNPERLAGETISLKATDGSQRPHDGMTDYERYKMVREKAVLGERCIQRREGQ